MTELFKEIYLGDIVPVVPETDTPSSLLILILQHYIQLVRANNTGLFNVFTGPIALLIRSDPFDISVVGTIDPSIRIIFVLHRMPK